VFLERKITGRMHGNEFAEFSAILGWKALKDSVDQFGKDEDGFTQLVTNLDGKDPDDAFSSIPYVFPIVEISNMGRRKDLISYMRFNRELAEQKYSNSSYRPISVTSDSSH
jgi:hypothetical protein